MRSTALVAIVAAHGAAASFNVLQHLGGNGQWFQGPNVFGIDDAPPTGCMVDMAAFASRHGSRYPDKGAYGEWTALAKKIHAANFSTTAPELQFLSSWEPVLTNPTLQIANLSATGRAELAVMGQHYRARYPDLFPSDDDDDGSFTIWSNLFASSPRVLDSAKLFTQSYLSNTTADGHIIVLNATAPAAVPGGDSLSPSDACPAFDDNGGGAALDEWEAAYLPPIVARINALLAPPSSLFNTSDVAIFPYLCGFETQITRRRSPWCDVFTPSEILAYEYAQDLRYWYGHGPGNPVGNVTMAPFLLGVLRRFADGPDAVYHTLSESNDDADADDACDGSSSQGRSSWWRPNPLIAAFTNDGPVMQLAAATGVFDAQPPLSGAREALNRTFRASNVVPMRGTVGFERLTCSCEDGAGQDGVFVRVLFNGVVYPVAACQDGPGSSCELDEYVELVRAKLENVGGWGEVCGLTGDEAEVTGEEGSDFLWRKDVSWGKDVSPWAAL